MSIQEPLTTRNAGIDKEFAKLIHQPLKSRIKKIILFGSRARGDFTEDSDFDILVVVDKNEKFIRETILDASVEIMNRYSELIGCIICDENEWEIKKKFPIGLNILKEGIEL